MRHFNIQFIRWFCIDTSCSSSFIKCFIQSNENAPEGDVKHAMHYIYYAPKKIIGDSFNTKGKPTSIICTPESHSKQHNIVNNDEVLKSWSTNVDLINKLLLYYWFEGLNRQCLPGVHEGGLHNRPNVILWFYKSIHIYIVWAGILWCIIYIISEKYIPDTILIKSENVINNNPWTIKCTLSPNRGGTWKTLPVYNVITSNPQ